MSEKDFQDEMTEKINDISLDVNMEEGTEESSPPLFYRCVCSECGKYALTVDSGVSIQSMLLGITSYGEIGCSPTELDTDHQLGIYCGACRHQICGDSFPNDICEEEFLSEWAKSNGKALTALTFACPKCDSQGLSKVEVGIQFSNRVVAVCESDTPGNEPLIAVSQFRHIAGSGSHRYRCSKGHELAKDDGTPVETAEELVEWLKAHHAVDRG